MGEPHSGRYPVRFFSAAKASEDFCENWTSQDDTILIQKHIDGPFFR